jgi:hypothetical protein
MGRPRHPSVHLIVILPRAFHLSRRHVCLLEPTPIDTMTLDDLLGAWRRSATEMREWGDDRGAAVLDRAVVQLDEAIRSVQSEAMRLAEASRESGYTADHLARLIRTGKLPNAGRRHAPRVRRADLPCRANRIARESAERYDPAADARSLLGRRLHDGGSHGTT